MWLKWYFPLIPGLTLTNFSQTNQHHADPTILCDKFTPTKLNNYILINQAADSKVSDQNNDSPLSPTPFYAA